MEKIAFFINPKIRNFRKIEIELQHHFLDFDYQFFISEYHGHLLELPQKAIADGYNCMIAVGGDGTLNEVLNGIINAFKTEKDYNWEKISTIKLGVFPAGSGNDFVRNIYDSSLLTLKKLIVNQQSKFIDIGVARFADTQNKPSQRFFINITDVGIGGEVVITKEKMPQFLSPKFSYLLSIFMAFIFYKKHQVIVKSENFSYQGKILNFVIANGRYFGNAIGIAPHAEIDDGFFSVTNIQNVSILDYILNIGTAKKCKKINHPEISYHKSKEILVESTTKKMTIDMDGEFVGYAPLELTCLPKKIRFIL